MLMQHKMDDATRVHSLEQLARHMRSAWRVIVAVFLIVGLIGTIFVLLREPRYTSTALLLLDRPNGDGSGSKVDISESKVDTEVEMLRAFSIVEAVAQRLKAEEIRAAASAGPPPAAPAAGDEDAKLASPGGEHDTDDGSAEKTTIPSAELLEFERRFRITRRGMTDVIAIDATAETPERAAKLANLYAEVYLDQQLSGKLTSAQRNEDILRQRIETIKQQLNEKSGQIDLRRQLDETLGRFSAVVREAHLVQSDLRLAAPALPIAKETFPSRKVLVFLAWLLAGVAASAAGLYRVRHYVVETIQFTRRR